ncbi:MAG: TerC family protein, partial [Coriobacteriia bacterium]|nr:TerC family protein [Coriobacteriia bacterium]
MAELFTIQALIALLTLTILEIVLAVDNIIFLAIVTEDVPEAQKASVRRLGLGLALIGRVLMVLGLTWLLGLDKSLFGLMGHDFSAK